MPQWLPAIVAGPFVGSFIGTVIRRLPEGRSVLRGRSRCEHCGGTLEAADLVPIVSWLRYRGRCRHCGTALGQFYPAVELAAAAVAGAAAATDYGDPARLWCDCVLGWILLAAGWIDVERLTLPDVLTLPLILLGLGATAWQEPDALTDHAAAAALGYLAFRGIAWAYRRVRAQEGLGEGDAKLLAAAGAWLGVQSLATMVFVAAAWALAFAAAARLGGWTVTRSTALPFGAFLAAACFCVRLYQSGM